MPLKWKIYYACAMYVLLWSVFIFGFSIYEGVWEGIGNQRGWMVLLMWGILAISVIKAALSFRVLRFYSRHHLLAKTERAIFIIFFVLNALFSTGLLLLSVFLIIPEDFIRLMREAGSGQANYREIIFDASFFGMFICTAWLAVFDLILLRAIRKSHDDNLLSFEFGSAEN